MHGFPFLEEDLLSQDSFISYCSARDIRIDRSFLELLHKKGLVYPCIRLNPGIDIFRKIKSIDRPDEIFVLEKDLYKFKIVHLYEEKYYSRSCVSPGKSGWLAYYVENNMVEYPIRDKEFIPWKKFKFTVAEFQKDPSYYDNHREFYYSKKQIYPIKHILDWRAYKIRYNVPPTEKHFAQLREGISRRLQAFDEDFIKNKYDDYHNFFEFLKKLENLRKQAARTASEVLKKDKPHLNFDSEEGYNEYRQEYESEKNRLFKELPRDVNYVWLEDWREKIINFGMPSHQDLTLYKFIENKQNISDFQAKGRIRFILDSIDIAGTIEDFFTIVGFEEFLTVEKYYWSVDNVKYCDICGKSFIPNKLVGNRAKTCESLDCRKKYNNKIKREGRKSGKYES